MTLKATDITGEAYHHTLGDVCTLHELARMLPENPVIVNIGACFGTSAISFLEARADAYVFSVDIAPCQDETHHIALAGLDKPYRCVRVLGPSQTVGLQFAPASVDMVFVDGAHDYEAVRDDIAAWKPVVKDGGLLVFHDYDKPICPKVKPAVDVYMSGVPVRLEESIIAFRITHA